MLLTLKAPVTIAPHQAAEVGADERTSPLGSASCAGCGLRSPGPWLRPLPSRSDVVGARVLHQARPGKPGDAVTDRPSTKPKGSSS